MFCQLDLFLWAIVFAKTRATRNRAVTQSRKRLMPSLCGSYMMCKRNEVQFAKSIKVQNLDLFALTVCSLMNVFFNILSHHVELSQNTFQLYTEGLAQIKPRIWYTDIVVIKVKLAIIKTRSFSN